ncbi:MAG: dihydropteroate synthase [Chloroflexi bacterium]|nr:dihydropteroate synthase [Chloroflexota bacterium]MYD46960.1 dihydropteroate synthase [Chloroflexota bacterium]
MPTASDIPTLTVAGGEPLVWGRRTYVMGIVNLTPDSFSGDGLAGNVAAAVALARRMEADGADIIDVGAESTRPGSAPISAEAEAARLLPALEAICKTVNIPVSVDTYKARVAQRAIGAGAAIVNDVWGLLADGAMARVVASVGAPAILMHNQRKAQYDDLVPDVIAGLRRIAGIARAAGIPHQNIILDPGIGFGKTADHNLELLRRLPELRALGYPLLLGVSRKSTIGRVLNLPAEERLEGTAAAVAISIAGGADIVRVHDVKEMVRVARMTDAIVRDWRPAGWPSRP